MIVDNVSDVTQLVSASSFSPQSGMSVVTNVFLTGLFNSDIINLTSFTQRFSQNGAPVLAGDYNQNGVVDAADYVVWRKNFGTQASYDIWRAHFGQTAGSGAGIITNATVPEPATLALTLFALAHWCFRPSRAALSVAEVFDA